MAETTETTDTTETTEAADEQRERDVHEAGGQRTGPLAPALSDALDRIHVDISAGKATVDGRPVDAESIPDLQEATASLVYGVFHSGLTPDRDGFDRTRRDEEKENLLRARVPHTLTTLHDVPVIDEGETDADVLLVLLDGVRVTVPRAHVMEVKDGERLATLAIPSSRPHLSPGFFLVDGGRGRLKTRRGVLRVYVHLTEFEPAQAVWHDALSVLEDSGARYRAKVASNDAGYPRRDALVVYLEPMRLDLASRLAELTAGRPGIGSQTSIFARRIASGVAVAYDPLDEREDMQALSFGQHRSIALVEGLFTSLIGGEADARDALVARSLRAAGIDPLAPELNLAAES